MKLTGTVCGNDANYIREASQTVALRYFGNSCFSIEIIEVTEEPRPVPELHHLTWFKAKYEARPQHDWTPASIPGATCKNCEARIQ